MLVHERYKLPADFKTLLKTKVPDFGFNGYGEMVYYRTYSRIMANGKQESWADTVIRVIEGAASITVDNLRRKLNVPVDEVALRTFFIKAALSMFNMEWLPPGRGLWVGGTDYVFERGSAALNNCGFVNTSNKPSFASAMGWQMDMLMCGVGVGFAHIRTSDYPELTPVPIVDSHDPMCEYIIDDTREGWVHSIVVLLEYLFGAGMYFRPYFDYSRIRKRGLPIRGFGGTASGPEPLMTLHAQIWDLHKKALQDPATYTSTRIICDIGNYIGCCVVAGNVRRSAELFMGQPSDETFLDLKNYSKHPERINYGWMSNNSVLFTQSEEFDKYIPSIAQRIVDNGEPGFINLLNIQKYARYGREKVDTAIGVNPCSEIPLESYELCNLSEVFPTRCASKEGTYNAFVFATWYATTISTLLTHSPETNEVVNRNHRIGVSISGIADLFDTWGCTQVITMLRKWYATVDETNSHWCTRYGIPKSIRMTTVKPSGTISLLAGVSPGMHFPTFDYAIRRTRVGADNVIAKFLMEQGVPYEQDVVSANTLVFSTPTVNKKSRPAKTVSAWEQLALQAMLQREYADNMVSCTVYFDRDTEAHQLEQMLAHFAPVLKSTSMSPHSDQGSYAQMPYEGVSEEVFAKLLEKYPKIDWSKFSGSDGMDSKFCSNDTCDIGV